MKFALLWVLPILLTAADLGDYLAGKGQYFEAITEYQRQLYFRDYESRDALLLKMARAYYAGGQNYPAAVQLVDQITDSERSIHDREALVLLARIYWEIYDYAAMRNVLDFLQANYADIDPREIQYIKTWTYIYSAEWDTAIVYLEHLEGTSDRALIEDIRKVQKLPQKSKKLAITLSKIVPGSGQLYAGDYKNTALSLGLVGSITASMIWNITQQAYFVAAVKYMFLYSRYARGSLKHLAEKIDRDNIDRIGDYLKSISRNYPDPVEMLKTMQTTSG